MRATIRLTNSDIRAEDATAAVKLLDIDETANYRMDWTFWTPGQATEHGTAYEAGDGLREITRILLMLPMHEVEQNEADTITLRWTRKTKRNNYRTHQCVISKVA
ncbi:hypothetical protein [Streptomyces sp. NPDC053560]|uniref:hypothetical protein n=1 Tax=Streptomyces sp. NPDC053560 TaxID=3365711 RepID=UPI0037D0BFE0